MPIESNDHDQEFSRNIKSRCRRYKNYHVIAHLNDGSQIQGILDDYDDDGVTMLMPEDVDIDDDDRQYGGYGRRRFRRFRRRRFPFFVFVVPYFSPYPYYYPY